MSVNIHVTDELTSLAESMQACCDAILSGGETISIDKHWYLFVAPYFLSHTQPENEDVVSYFKRFPGLRMLVPRGTKQPFVQFPLWFEERTNVSVDPDEPQVRLTEDGFTFKIKQNNRYSNLKHHAKDRDIVVRGGQRKNKHVLLPSDIPRDHWKQVWYRAESYGKEPYLFLPESYQYDENQGCVRIKGRTVCGTKTTATYVDWTRTFSSCGEAPCTCTSCITRRRRATDKKM